MKQHGIDVSATTDFCGSYMLSKQPREAFGARKKQPTIAGEQINAAACAPMQKISLGRARNYVRFKNDYTKFRRVFFMNKK